MKNVSLFSMIALCLLSAFAWAMQKQDSALVAKCSLYEGDYQADKVPIEVKDLWYDGNLPTATIEFIYSGHSYFAQVRRDFILNSHGGYYAAGFHVWVDDGPGYQANVVAEEPLSAGWGWGNQGILICSNPKAPHIPI